MQSIASINEIIISEANYKKFTTDVAKAFERLSELSQGILFRVKSNDLYAVFLDNIPESERQRFNCNTCRNFINSYGNIVWLTDDGMIKTVWEEMAKNKDKHLNSVVSMLHKAVSASEIDSLLLNTKTKGNKTLNGFSHIHGNIEGIRVKDVGEATHLLTQAIEFLNDNFKTYYKADAKILRKGLSVLEASSSHKARTNIASLERHIDIAERLNAMYPKQRTNYIWLYVSVYLEQEKLEGSGLRINNSALGEFLDVLSRSTAKRALAVFDDITDVTKHNRTTAQPSDKAIEVVEKAVSELGLEKAFARKLATPEDVAELRMWLPKTATSDDVSVFASIKSNNKKTPAEKVSGSISVSMRQFVEKVLPTAESMYLDSINIGGCGGLTVPEIPDSGILFKYDSDRSWFVKHAQERTFMGTYNIKGVYRNPSCEFGTEGAYDGIFFHIDRADLPKHWFAEYFKDIDLTIFPELLRTDLHKYRHAIERLSEAKQMVTTDDSMICKVASIANKQFNDCAFHVLCKGIVKTYQIVLW